MSAMQTISFAVDLTEQQSPLSPNQPHSLMAGYEVEVGDYLDHRLISSSTAMVRVK